MTDNQISNADKFKKLTFENKTKLISALSEVTGRKKTTIYQRWLYDNLIPDKYRDLVTKGINQIYENQTEKENQLENQLEKLLS